MNHRPASTQFDQLHSQYSSLVRAVVSRTLRRPDEVMDVVQQIWIEAWALIQAGEHLDKSWFTLRSQSRSIDRRKQLARDPDSLDSLASDETDGDDLGLDHLLALSDCRPGLDRSMIEAIRFCIDDLSPALRDAVNAHYFASRTIADIALAEGVPIGTIKRRLHDAREALRARFIQSDSQQEAA